MTGKAVQILDALRKDCSDLTFRWEPQGWILGDTSYCVLTATLRSNPSKTKSMIFTDGIEAHAVAKLVDGFKTHVVAALLE